MDQHGQSNQTGRRLTLVLGDDNQALAIEGDVADFSAFVSRLAAVVAEAAQRFPPGAADVQRTDEHGAVVDHNNTFLDPAEGSLSSATTTREPQ